MNKKTKFLRTFCKDVLADVIIVLVMVLFIRHFIFAPFRVSGPSMCNTFNVYNGECFYGEGEFVITSRLSTWSVFGWSPGNIKRGDILIFKAPYNERGDSYIKRVIGLPGDEVKVEDGYVYIKNETGEFQQLSEPYLSEENLGNTNPYRSNSETYLVPEGQYFMLGDNRLRSNDSRRCFSEGSCTDGKSPFLESDFIQGEVKFVLFPFSHFRFVQKASYEL
jgi:signal peptidase I